MKINRPQLLSLHLTGDAIRRKKAFFFFPSDESDFLSESDVTRYKKRETVRFCSGCANDVGKMQINQSALVGGCGNENYARKMLLASR